MDLHTLDRMLDVVSEHSQRLFLDGYLGLLLIGGDENASITLGDEARRTIGLLRVLDQGSGDGDDPLIDGVVAGWHTTPDRRETRFLIERALMLCSTLSEVWSLWEMAKDKSVNPDLVGRMLRSLHGVPNIEEFKRLYVRNLLIRQAMRGWARQINRVNRLHPYVVMNEIERIRDEFDLHLRKVRGEWAKIAEGVILADTSHLLGDHHRAIRAWYLKRRYGLGSTEIGARIIPQIQDRYETIRKDVRDMDQYLVSIHAYAPGTLLGTEGALRFADDLEKVVPLFKKT